MIQAPATSVITIDGQAIEYRLERRGRRTVLILHGGHMSALPVRLRDLQQRRLFGFGRILARIWLDGCGSGTFGGGVRRALGKPLPQAWPVRGDRGRHLDRSKISLDLGRVLSRAGPAGDLDVPYQRTDRCQWRRRAARTDSGYPKRRCSELRTAEALAATLPNEQLVEIDRPTHMLWLGEGSDRTAGAIDSFIRS